jgi:hypothetical protein
LRDPSHLDGRSLGAKRCGSVSGDRGFASADITRGIDSAHSVRMQPSDHRDFHERNAPKQARDASGENGRLPTLIANNAMPDVG